MTSAVSADWVVPVDGPPIEGGVVRFEKRSDHRGRPGRVTVTLPTLIAPGFVNAHASRDSANYAVSATAARLRGSRRMSHARRSLPEECWRWQRLGALELAAARRDDRRRLQLCGSGRSGRAAASCGRSSTWRSSPSIPPTPSGGTRSAHKSRALRSSPSESHPTRRTPAPSTRIGLPRSASRSARIWQRARTRPNGSARRGAAQGDCVAARPATRPARCPSTRARALPPSLLRPLRRGRRLRRRAPSPRDVPVAHRSRSNALLGCGCAADRVP